MHLAQSRRDTCDRDRIHSLLPQFIVARRECVAWSRRSLSWLLLNRAVHALLIVLAVAVANSSADERSSFFESKIRPVLIEHCYDCHSVDSGESEGGLRVDSRDAMRRGGESGPLIDFDQPEASLLVSAIKYESLEMPPDQKLPAHVVRDFERWISEGAFDPRKEMQSHEVESVESEIDYEQGRQFWSFRRPQHQQLPSKHVGYAERNRIDRFVNARLHRHGLHPAQRANPETLLRRLCFDLTGLPPDDQQRRWLDQLHTSRGTEDLIESLLNMPAFGEHFARMWLDLMRYADDQAHIVGNNKSLFYPNASRYRDWVIDAWNRDLPYDEFVRLQIAADQYTPDDTSDDVALGFLGLGPKYYRRGDLEVMADEWEDRIDVVSRGLLGLTVACARCHDHKYDPIGTADYYAIAGVFASTEMFNRPLDHDRETSGNGQAKSPEDALHIVRDTEPRDLSIMIRGDVNRTGPVVQRRFLTILFHDVPPALGNSESSGRLELAECIASETTR